VKIGYADPPYIGQSAKHYKDHPDYAGEVDHADLVERLELVAHRQPQHVGREHAPQGGDEGGGDEIGQVVIVKVPRLDESRTDRNLIGDSALAVTAEGRASGAVQGHRGRIKPGLLQHLDRFAISLLGIGIGTVRIGHVGNVGFVAHQA